MNFPAYDVMHSIINKLQDGKETRIVQINFDSGLKVLIENALGLVPQRIQVIPFSYLKVASPPIEADSPVLGKTLIKHIVNFVLGFFPIISSILFAKDLLDIMIKHSIKKTELNLLQKKVHVYGHPKKRYKKLHTIIWIDDLSQLNESEYNYACFLSFLINNKFITHTAMLSFQNQNRHMRIVPMTHKIHTIKLTSSDIQLYLNTNKAIDAGFIQIINIVGLQYLETIFQIINKDSGYSIIIENLIKQMTRINMETGEVISIDMMNRFLKICSLLLERFSMQDVATFSHLYTHPYTELLTSALKVKFLKNPEESKPLEYAFIESFLREYYQNTSNVIFEKNVYDAIFEYLSSTYPNHYTDIALLSSLIDLPELQVLSNYIIAYYYEEKFLPFYKKQKLVEYLNESDFGTILLWMEEAITCINEMDISHTIEKCTTFLQLMTKLGITDRAKICALHYASNLMYEISNDDAQRIELIDFYQELLTKLNIYSTPSIDHIEYITDAVLFSSCIEENSRVEKFAQRLMVFIEKNSIYLGEIKRMHLYRLGNALYPTDPLKASILTKQAYELSKDTILEHELARINYSASLIVCGKYGNANELFQKDKINFSYGFNVSISYENNQIIASFFNNKKKGRLGLHKKFRKIIEQFPAKKTSDMNIVNNNYVAALLISEKNENLQMVESICTDIERYEDIYHQFFSIQNRLILYFLRNDKESFNYWLRMVRIPKLLFAYNDFFNTKMEIMSKVIGEVTTLDELYNNLLSMKEFYPSCMYDHYIQPILFGVLERWFD